MRDKLLFGTIGLLVGIVMMPLCAACAQASDFQDGFRVVAVGGGKTLQFYYATSAGNVYTRGNGQWNQAPEFLGNFFGGQPVPGDFLAGFRAVTEQVGNSPLLYYASSDGNVYRQGGTNPWNQAPGSFGNFFGGQSVPGDFQQGFQIANEGTGNFLAYFYASSTGDVYQQSGNAFSGPPAYLGNFLNGGPLANDQSTWGKVKAKFGGEKKQ
jgi:hypothetical protein